MKKLELFVYGSEDDEALIRDLYEAILDDASMRPARKEFVAAPAGPGQMGAHDVISLILNPEVVSALSACVTAWFATRKARFTLKLRGAAGEADIEVKGSDIVTEHIVRRALDLAEGITREAPQ